MCSGSEAGSYCRLIDFGITLNSGLEDYKEERKNVPFWRSCTVPGPPRIHKGTSIIRNCLKKKKEEERSDH